MHPVIEDMLRQSMGFSPETVGRAVIDKIVRRHMVASGDPTPEEYIERLQQNPEELKQLIEAVAIPETWFFRDPQAFAALGKWAVREWLPHNPTGTLRVLSIPCSTGEEPYSISLTLLNAGFARGRFEIDALDISDSNVEKAKRGFYGRNSFRGGYPDNMQSYVTDTGTGFQVSDTLKSAVSFRQANIFDSEFGYIRNAYDVIFCRNLLIYFDGDTQKRAIQVLNQMLRSDGLLFVGSAESYLAGAIGYVVLGHRMSFGYRKKPRKAQSEGQGTSMSGVRRALRAVRRTPTPDVTTGAQDKPKPPVVVTSKPATQPQQAAPPPAQPHASLQLARERADAGDLHGARAMCTEIIGRTGATAECYTLLGLIADGGGNPREAAAYYRKALYLDPVSEEALMHLAFVVEDTGDVEQAARLRARAQRPVSTNVTTASEVERRHR